MRIVFMGTPDFAVPTLEALHQKGHDIICVVTQPDRPKGRGQKLAFSPVKEISIKLGLDVEQPEKVKDKGFVDKLRAWAPDVIAVVAFGQLLSQEILDIPKYGCINLHASLLPKYRGAAPIHYAILHGEKVTGNTTMLMDIGMDTGDMLLTNQIDITDDDTTGSIHDKLAASGGALMLETLEHIGDIVPRKQDENMATYASKIDREMELINWDAAAEDIHNKIRAFNPWPVAYTLLAGSRIKLFASRLAKDITAENFKPGQFAGETDEGFLIAAKDCALEILSLQPESRKRISAKDYIKGYNQNKDDMIFGSNY